MNPQQGKAQHRKRCNKYADENGLEILTEKPEGWKELLGISAPIGSVVITNRKSFKQKDYKKALYILDGR